MRAVPLVLVVLARVASAQPAYDPDPVPEATPDDVPLRRAYMQLGAQIGADHGETFTATRADGGYHLGHSMLWVHGAVVVGGPLPPFSLGIGTEHEVSGSLHQVVGGIEARACGGVAVCGAIGLDAGLMSLEYDDKSRSTPMSSASWHYSSAVVVPRMQFDFGGDHVRLRPSIEFPLGPYVTGTNVSVAVALQM